MLLTGPSPGSVLFNGEDTNPDVPFTEEHFIYMEVMGGEPDSLKGRLDGLRFDGIWFLVSAHPEGAPGTTRERAIDHVGFVVDDIDQACVRLREQGVETVNIAVHVRQSSRWLARCFFVRALFLRNKSLSCHVMSERKS